MQIAGNPESPLFAMAAEVPSASALYHAAEKVRDAGYSRWDVYSPFPIHGMDHAMGLKKSWLSAMVFFGGLAGLATAVILQFYPSSIEYPLIVAGKPTNFYTVPAFFPIMFELTVLLSAFTATFGMLALNGLPRWNHPIFNWDRFKKVSNDGFFVAIEATDPKFDRESTLAMLESIGAKHITLVHED
ncbi:MAG: DUF3341 domain-containing protein [Chthoniobacterales bacterium]|nr:DUF3341 domain-containing protein [Chthoniobacterales bacterium]